MSETVVWQMPNVRCRRWLTGHRTPLPAAGDGKAVPIANGSAVKASEYNTRTGMTNRPRIDYSLSEERIDLWPVFTSSDGSLLPQFRDLLGPLETERCAAFRFEYLRANYTIVHGILRILAAKYLDCDPAKLQFGTGRYQKPYILPRGRLQFNLSHSGDLALFGFATNCEIGVDVEKKVPKEDLLEIAGSVLCAEEMRDLMSLDAGERQEAFFRVWTRKEAYVKAVGNGLQTPLDTFRVSLRPAEDARLLHINGNYEAGARWMLHTIDSLPGAAAALAYPGPRKQVRLMELLSPADFLEG